MMSKVTILEMQRVIIYAFVIMTLSACATSGSFKVEGGDDAKNLWEYDEIASNKGYGRWKDTTYYGYRIIGWNKLMALPFYVIFDENNKFVEYVGTVGTEIKPEEYSVLRRARMNHEAEQRERRKAERKQLTKELSELLIKAKENSKVVICTNADDCKKAFTLTQIFISQNAGMKIQLATDTIIETYGSSTKLVMKATKSPDIGNEEIINLTVICPVNSSSYGNAILKSEVRCKKIEIEKLSDYLGYIKSKVPLVKIR